MLKLFWLSHIKQFLQWQTIFCIIFFMENFNIAIWKLAWILCNMVYFILLLYCYTEEKINSNSNSISKIPPPPPSSKLLGQLSSHGVGVSIVHHQTLWQASKQQKINYIYLQIRGGGGGGGGYPNTPKPHKKRFSDTKGGGVNIPTPPPPPCIRALTKTRRSLGAPGRGMSQSDALLSGILTVFSWMNDPLVTFKHV